MPNGSSVMGGGETPVFLRPTIRYEMIIIITSFASISSKIKLSGATKPRD